MCIVQYTSWKCGDFSRYPNFEKREKYSCSWWEVFTIGWIWSWISKVYLGSMSSAVLIGWNPSTPPPSARIWAHIRGRFWSDRRHLFVTPSKDQTVEKICLISFSFLSWFWDPCTPSPWCRAAHSGKPAAESCKRFLNFIYYKWLTNLLKTRLWACAECVPNAIDGRTANFF